MSIGHMTYLGSCKVADKLILCTNMSASLDQRILFFDHILGLQDKMVPGVAETSQMKKGPATTGSSELLNTQKRIFRYSPAIAKASLSAPVSFNDDSGSEAFQEILNKAIHGDDIEVEMKFWKQNAPHVKISKAKVVSVAINLKAGEVVSFVAEIVGAQYDFDTTGFSNESECLKLLTWDRCSIKATPVSYDISSFTLNISNPPLPIYTHGSIHAAAPASNGMMPLKIRLGIQEVTGTIGVYGPTLINVPSTGEVEFSLNGIGRKVKVVFVQPKDDASGGIYVRTIMFNGVNDGTVWSNL